MIIYGYRNFLDRAAYERDPVRELARVYVEVRKAIKEAGGAGDDEEEAVNPIAEACRAETAKLHAGDPANNKLWQEVLPHSMKEVHAIYQRLGTRPFDFEHGESFYHSMLPAVVAHLLDKGLAGLSQGAVVIPNANGKIPSTTEELQKEEPPGIIRKKDGAYTYYTSDLATIKYRVDHFHPDAMLYVVGVPQTLHFKTLFAQARRWGYDRVELEHVKFGSVLGEDKKPFGARKGGVIELASLIDEGISPCPREVRGELRRAEGPRAQGAGPVRRGEAGDPRGRRRRGHEVRRPESESHERLRLQLRQDAGDRGQHRDLHAIRLRPLPEHLPRGGRR